MSMSTIQSRRPQKQPKNHVTLTWKFPWKSCVTSHLHVGFLPYNPINILKAFPKTFPTKIKPAKCLAKEKTLAKRKKSLCGRFFWPCSQTVIIDFWVRLEVLQKLFLVCKKCFDFNIEPLFWAFSVFVNNEVLRALITDLTAKASCIV